MMQLFGFVEEEVDKSIIRAGDLIRHDGKVMTVSKNNIRTDPCMGKTLFGDSYRLGYRRVIKVNYQPVK